MGFPSGSSFSERAVLMLWSGEKEEVLRLRGLAVCWVMSWVVRGAWGPSDDLTGEEKSGQLIGLGVFGEGGEGDGLTWWYED
jgi:hypothetical protein